MGILIRTSEVPTRDRLEAWRSVVCDTLGPLDFRIDGDAPLQGEIAGGPVGELTVGKIVTSTPHTVFRTAGLVRQGGPDVYRVVLAMAGRPLVAQDDRRVRLRPGEFAIYDFGRPYDLTYDTSVQLAVWSVPRGLLAVSPDAVGKVTAVSLGTGSGLATLAGSLLARAAVDVESYRPASAFRLSTAVTDLLAGTVAEYVESSWAPPAEQRRRMQMLRIRAFIEEQLSDPELTPAIVAAAHHMSVRQLHRLFEVEQATVAGWIRHRRLERCRQDLADPAGRVVPVSAVAARWGLPDAALFGRQFRQAYGMPPGDYRKVALIVNQTGTGSQGRPDRH